MKPIKLLLITAAIFMFNSAYAVQYKFIAMDNSIYTKMCVLAGNNEKKALKSTLRRHENNVRILANSTFCNGIYLANFAKKYQANNTYHYLKKYTYKHNLDKATKVTIKDVVTRAAENGSEKEIIIVYVGH